MAYREMSIIERASPRERKRKNFILFFLEFFLESFGDEDSLGEEVEGQIEVKGEAVQSVWSVETSPR